MPSLGESLRTYRQQAKISGAELARRAGSSQSWISRIENDRFKPSAPEVERIAKALDLTPEQTAELTKLAREPKPELSAQQRRAVIQRIDMLLGMVAEEVRRLR
jgi:transcriptional regulator with XRE-family HTH domain